MNMKASVKVRSVLDRYPEAEKVFVMYDIEINNKTEKLSIEGICDQFNVDMEDILMDLEELISETKEPNWLNQEEDWTEGFTEESSVEPSNSSGMDFDDTEEVDEESFE